MEVMLVLKAVSVAGFCAFCIALVWGLCHAVFGSRKGAVDLVLAACFSMFLFVAWFFEPAVIYQCGWEGLPHCHTVIGELWFFYANTFDPVFLNLPFWLRLVCSLDTFLFGPFYALSLWVYATGRQESAWYAVLALPFAGGLIYSTIVYFGYEVLAEAHRASLFWVFVINLPWTLAPILLIIRLASGLKQLEQQAPAPNGASACRPKRS